MLCIGRVYMFRLRMRVSFSGTNTATQGRKVTHHSPSYILYYTHGKPRKSNTHILTAVRNFNSLPPSSTYIHSLSPYGLAVMPPVRHFYPLP